MGLWALPCIRRLSPQYMRQSKIWCPIKTTRKQPFSSPLAKIKTMVKLLYPLLIINSGIPGLIWRRTAHFVQNKATIILPGHARRTTISRQIRSLETQDVSYFSLFAMWNGFGNCKSPFANISCHLQWEKMPDFNAFPVNLHWREDTKFFPACRILIGQFKFPAHQPYGRFNLTERFGIFVKKEKFHPRWDSNPQPLN